MLSDAFYRAGVWKAGDLRAKEGLPTGFPVLDSVLPSKGWPKDSFFWVCPPHIPYVPALQANNINLQQLLIIEPENEESADSDYKLWVFEQALRFQQCGIAMVWLDDVPSVSLRRLQLSCEAGKTCGVIFRPERFATEASPASLRVKVDACKNGTTSVHILKARGLTRERTLEINDL